MASRLGADERDSPRVRSADLWVSLVLIGLGILFFADFLFSSKNFYYRDILNFHYPLRKVLIDAYARGEFPLWNPFIDLGQPLLANPNCMAFYPTNLLHLLLSFNYAFKLHFILHPLLAGLGMYFFQRQFGIKVLAAFGGALAYGFSGTVLSFLNLYNIVPAIALLPWIGWAFWRALGTNWLWRSLLFGALLAVQVIAFEPLMFQNVVWLLAGLSLLFLWEAGDWRKAAASILRSGLTGAMFALGLAAVQVLPTLELLPRSTRGAGFDFNELSLWSMHPFDLLSTLLPNLFGDFYTLGLANSWGESFHHGREGYLVSFFLGSGTVLLATMSFFSPRRRLQLSLTALTVASIGLALGKYNPIYVWLAKHVSSFQVGRYPSKFFLLSTLTLSLMAALGLEVVFESGRLERRKWDRMAAVAMCGLILALAILGVALFWQSYPQRLESWIRLEVDPALTATKDFAAITSQLVRSVLSTGVFLLISSSLILVSRIWKRTSLLGGLFLLLLGAELMPANLRLSPLISDADVDFVPEVNQYIRKNGPRDPFRVVPPTLLKPMPDLELRVPNRSVAWLTLFYRMSGQPLYGIMNGIQYSLDRSVDHLSTTESEELWKICSRLPEPAALDLLAKLNSPMVLALGTMRDPRLQLVASFDTRSELKLHAYWLDNTLARSYFVAGVVRATSRRDALGKFLDPSFPVGHTVVLEDAQQSESKGEMAAGTSRILDYQSSRVLCEVVAKIPGYLVLLDSYYPGWVAHVDGRPGEILRANYTFRAVKVPAGKHRIEFRYRPRSFYMGLWVTSLTLAVWLISFILRVRPKISSHFGASVLADRCKAPRRR